MDGLNHKRTSLRWWLTLVVAAVTVFGIFLWSGYLRAQSKAGPANAQAPSVFTPAHSSLADAAKHFFGIRPEVVQPIAYTHKPHIEKAQLQCDFCHDTVSKGPVAHIPSVKTCMICHELIATESPIIQQVTAYSKRGEEIPWQRVYGWSEESHVRFNHAPHIRAEVQCSTCHGDVAQMNDAKRVVNHTMQFCIDCHMAKKASNDCLTCHF